MIMNYNLCLFSQCNFRPKETLANKDGDDKEAKNETPDKDKSVVDPQVEGGETASSLEEPENEASSGDWWSTATSSLMGSVGVLEKAVNSVSNATSSAVQVAKTKVSHIHKSILICIIH